MNGIALELGRLVGSGGVAGPAMETPVRMLGTYYRVSFYPP